MKLGRVLYAYAIPNLRISGAVYVRQERLMESRSPVPFVSSESCQGPLDRLQAWRGSYDHPFVNDLTAGTQGRSLSDNVRHRIVRFVSTQDGI